MLLKIKSIFLLNNLFLLLHNHMHYKAAFAGMQRQQVNAIGKAAAHLYLAVQFAPFGLQFTFIYFLAQHIRYLQVHFLVCCCAQAALDHKVPFVRIGYNADV